MAELHPLLGPLAELVGTWVGQGTGHLPGQPDFAWSERLDVEHVGTPALAFHQRTTRPDGGPFHAEDGWVRVPPELQEDQSADQWQVELAVTSPTGILEALSGTLRALPDGFELDASSAMLARTPAAGQVVATRRRWTWDGTALTIEFWMATPTHPEPLHHLTTRLHRRTSMTTYTMTVTSSQGPAEAEAAVRDALQAEGFGILSEIDVQAKLQEKLGEDIGTYRILGACNPPLARKGIGIDADLGALLPCNVVIRGRQDGGTDIVAADPETMLAVADDAALDELACDARERIERALQKVAG